MKLMVYSATRLFAECLSSGFANHSKVESCVGISTLEKARGFLTNTTPAAIFVDLSGRTAWDDARELRRIADQTLLLALAVSDTPDSIVKCAEIGCASVIPRDSSIETALATLDRARRGEMRCSPMAAARLMDAVSRANNRRPEIPPILTPREGEVCALACDGLTNKEIARTLTCSEGTVKNHVHSILSKLNVPRRSGILRVLRDVTAPDQVMQSHTSIVPTERG